MHPRSLPLRLVTAALVLAATTALGTAAHAGPLSTLYLVSQTSQTLYTVQGTNVTGAAPAYCNHCEQPIAVDGDVRTAGSGNGFGGRYRLDLTQTGTTYAPSINVGLTDGTTDGQRNYAVAPGIDGGNAPAVYAFDRDWGHATLLFTLGAGVRAMDYADNTLWVVRGATQFFDQYSRSGTLLQTASYDAFARPGRHRCRVRPGRRARRRARAGQPGPGGPRTGGPGPGPATRQRRCLQAGPARVSWQRAGRTRAAARPAPPAVYCGGPPEEEDAHAAQHRPRTAAATCSRRAVAPASAGRL